MRTVLQHIRNRLESRLSQCPSLAELKQSEWSRNFENLMRNRLLMGAFRYGLLRAKGEQGYDLIASMRRRIELYNETGNLEYMVDVANLAMLEFEWPSKRNAHFSSVDDGEHCT